jgi:hypothetical protein
MIQFYSGKRLDIYFVTNSDGSCPVYEYLESLPDDVLVAFSSLTKILADNGRIQNIQQFRKIRDKIFEIKPKGYRFLGFFHKGAFVITNGFRKRGGGRSEKFPTKEFDKAQRFFKEIAE